jgi:prevent-host-death family protein
MQAVGVRELKAKLSHYLRLAKIGEVVLVTEHGRVIAALGPPAMTELPRGLAGLQVLVARGVAVPGRRKQPGSYPRTGLRSPAGTAQRLLDELRDDR